MEITTLMANQLIVGISLIIGIISLTASVLTCIFSFAAYARVIGIEKATHSVQYVPMNPEFDRQNEEFLQKSQKEDDWATSTESLLKEDEAYRKDMDEVMPDMLASEDDLKIHSF